MTSSSIVGATGPARDADTVLDAARDHVPDAAVVDARRVGGRRHLQAAVDQAGTVRQAGRSRARDPPMEVLLHVAGTDQIDAALDRVGLDGEVGSVAVACLGDGDVDGFLEELGWERDDAVLDPGVEQLRRLAAERGHPDDADPLDALIEDAALVALS